MITFMKSRSFFARSLALSLALLLAGAVAAWTGPSSAPPNGNVAAPVNVSGTAQVKSGGFWASSVGSDAGFCIGSSCITSWPADGSGFTGSGSTNYLTKFIGATALGNSLIYDNGTNVGIGTASPGYKLDVNGEVRLGSSANGGLRVISMSSNSVNLRPSISNGSITLTDDSGDAARGMTIANGGNVGIGATSPNGKLTIVNSAGGVGVSNYLSLRYDESATADYTVGRNGNTGFLEFTGNQTGYIGYTFNGNVGIGTASPGYKLDVIGDINVTGCFRINGTCSTGLQGPPGPQGQTAPKVRQERQAQRERLARPAPKVLQVHQVP
ncbi:MAG: hypothetical protein UY83_C0010G0004 [Candidatus Adlerbacteria bacterium GW2011_GWA1_54_10]|uniref:Uncharacterized protein n=1 Tax=Candidatus Adlerbacteria bacterium GW2011_GWA1_54_10 TaxID=1618605 RepID=A0A0G1XWI6_9BACT|nr:MAG: hypothetical protein UY83_C0010G0004 [Candidatus Adlerbacteria bacterium GW2011_GWA1_54_10]